MKIEELEEQKNIETEIFTEKGGVIDVLVQTKEGTQIDLNDVDVKVEVAFNDITLTQNDPIKEALFTDYRIINVRYIILVD